MEAFRVKHSLSGKVESNLIRLFNLLTFPLQFLSHRNTYEARRVNNVMHVKIAMVGGSYNSSRNRILQKKINTLPTPTPPCLLSKSRENSLTQKPLVWINSLCQRHILR